MGCAPTQVLNRKLFLLDAQPVTLSLLHVIIIKPICSHKKLLAHFYFRTFTSSTFLLLFLPQNCLKEPPVYCKLKISEMPVKIAFERDSEKLFKHLSSGNCCEKYLLTLIDSMSLKL